jgi:uncharacterized repeat protein (TIGR01451 family)
MIRRERLNKTLKLQLAIFACLLCASNVQAQLTPSDTDIDNTATINYSLAGTPQTLVESSPTGNTTAGAGNGTATTFKVDNLIDFTVGELDTTYTEVAPGSTSQAVAFALQNDGNTVQDFSLSAVELATGTADPFGGNDNFNATAVGIFREDGTTLGYQAAEDTATYVDELAADTSTTVYVVRDIGAGQADADISGVILIAQVAQGGTGGTQGADITSDDSGTPDDPTTVEIVFGDAAGDDAGDGAYDGMHSDTDAFLVRTATLEITKTSSVVSDPINGTTNPKAIPGATVEYIITVSNTAGTGTATSVVVSDDLSTEIGLGTIAFDLDGYAAANGLQVTAPNLYGGAATALSNASDADEGEWNAGTSVLSVNGIEVAPGQTATVNYRVTIQ